MGKKQTKFFIAGPAGPLESTFDPGVSLGALSALKAVVIMCHPHPLQGGTMDNKVVTTLMRSYRDLGIDVLRFNFRGVGKSAGAFDQGQGELEDALAMVEWVKEHRSDAPLLLAGFSFGSAIAARASHLLEGLVHLTLVAPPIERYDYDRAGVFNAPVCIVQGDQDERVCSAGVYDWAAQLRSPCELIRYSACGHFFHGFITLLKADLTHTLMRQITLTGSNPL